MKGGVAKKKDKMCKEKLEYLEQKNTGLVIKDP